MGSNYVKMRDQARELFLTRDMDEMIAKWNLESDEGALYAPYFGDRLRIDRNSAAISLVGEGYPSRDWVNETMVLFDLLTLAPTRPRASRRWASVSTLGGIIGAGHDRNLSHEKDAAKFAGKTEALAEACRRLGGIPAGKADAGFQIPVFRDFQVWFQLWDGDDEFPASIRYLFDDNALQYMHYETLWYLMGSTVERLEYYLR